MARGSLVFIVRMFVVVCNVCVNYLSPSAGILKVY